MARSPAAIAELLEEVLSAAGIPFALRRRQPLSSSALGRALLGLLRSAGSGGTAADVLAWLRAPGLLERPELADSLEIRLRRTGTEDAAGARGLWEERGWPLDGIDRVIAAEQRGPAALLERAGAELEWLFLAPRRGRGAVLGELEAREARALAAARGALSELRDLARRDAQLVPQSAAELARGARLRRVLQRRAAGARDGGGARPARAARAPGACAVPRRPQRGVLPLALAASAADLRRGRPADSSGIGAAARARATMRWPPSATCSMRRCRDRSSCWC